MNTKSVVNRTRGAHFPCSRRVQEIAVRAVVLLLLLSGVVGAFAQGKVSMQNDGASSVTLNTCPHLLGADCGLGGQAVPTSGPLPSGIFLKAGLYAGTTSYSLSLVSSVIINPAGGSGQAPGIIPTTHIILPFPGGSLAYFQLKVWDANYTTAEDAYNAISYSGQGALFTMTPGMSISYPPITGGGGSTWQDGPIIVPGWLDPPPFIIIDAQPTSQTVVQGGTATFSVSAHSSYLGYPLYFQWFFNGGLIPGANESLFHITNAQPAHAGTYSVSVHNSFFTVTSSSATLTVRVPPSVVTPPQSQTAELDAGVGLDVSANGDPPLVYQWFFNATNNLGVTGTNSHLELGNVQFSQSGAYSVVVTNSSGAATSPPALLNVVPVVERRPAAALSLNGVLNSAMNLDYTAVLDSPINWQPLDTVLLTNSPQPYVDIPSALAPLPQRFYRAWQTNGPPSILALNRVPAITLSGSIGTTYAWITSTNLARLTRG